MEAVSSPVLQPSGSGHPDYLGHLGHLLSQDALTVQLEYFDISVAQKRVKSGLTLGQRIIRVSDDDPVATLFYTVMGLAASKTKVRLFIHGCINRGDRHNKH